MTTKRRNPATTHFRDWCVCVVCGMCGVCVCVCVVCVVCVYVCVKGR